MGGSFRERRRTHWDRSWANKTYGWEGHTEFHTLGMEWEN